MRDSMFITIIKSLLRHQLKKMLLITLTIALGASLMTAMVNVVLGVEEKINAELKTYGANIMIQPQARALIGDLYNLGVNDDAQTRDLTYADFLAIYGAKAGDDAAQVLDADSLQLIKQIFWSHNITNVLPVKNLDNLYLQLGADEAAQGYLVNARATVFDGSMTLADGEVFNYGLQAMKNWWSLTGAYPQENGIRQEGATGADEAQQGGVQSDASHQESVSVTNDTELLATAGTKQAMQVVVGAELAKRAGLAVGTRLTLTACERGEVKRLAAVVSGIFTSGDADDNYLYGTLADFAPLNSENYSYIEIQALTTPDNDLARKAAKNPLSLTSKEWDTWYCTAYVSAVCYQLEDALSGVSAKAVRQVSESEGGILNKTKALLTLIAILAMVATTLGITNLISNFVIERSAEIGLCKALGAGTWRINSAVLTEIMAAGLGGAVIGYPAGLLFTEVIALTVFNSWIAPSPLALLLLLLMVLAVTLAGSVPALRYLNALDPKVVLHSGK